MRADGWDRTHNILRRCLESSSYRASAGARRRQPAIFASGPRVPGGPVTRCADRRGQAEYVVAGAATSESSASSSGVLFCQTRIADVSSFNGATLMPRPGIDTTAEPDFVAYVFGDD